MQLVPVHGGLKASVRMLILSMRACVCLWILKTESRQGTLDATQMWFLHRGLRSPCMAEDQYSCAARDHFTLASDYLHKESTAVIFWSWFLTIECGEVVTTWEIKSARDESTNEINLDRLTEVAQKIFSSQSYKKKHRTDAWSAELLSMAHDGVGVDTNHTSCSQSCLLDTHLFYLQVFELDHSELCLVILPVGVIPSCTWVKGKSDWQNYLLQVQQISSDWKNDTQNWASEQTLFPKGYKLGT